METVAGAVVEIPETPEAYGDSCRRLRAAGVDVVGVAGGDGTLRDVLSALIPAYGGAPPPVAIVPRGKTNVAAADVGGARSLARLAAALKAGEPGRVSVRRPIAVGAAGWTRYGFVFGAGAFERATRLANEKVHARGLTQGLGVAAAVAGAVGSMMSPAGRDGWRAGVPAALAVDGRAEHEGPLFVALATGLNRLTLGLWPFWGAGPGGFALTHIAAPPERLLAALPAVACGRPRPWMAEAGYRSVRADAADFRIHAPFIVDGDTFEPGPDGRVSLRAGPPVTFLGF